MNITMIGHSTVLIETREKRILTDPYFGLRGHIAYKRISPPAFSRQDLLDIDLLLVSHNHWDHNDNQFLRLLSPDIPVITARGISWILKLRGARNVIGLDMWESFQFDDLVITVVPALHVTIACGFIIQAYGIRLYFSGDTFYGSFMKTIGDQFAIDLALMPVTTYRIPMTMGPRGAVKAVAAINPRMVVPIHLGVMPRSPLMRTSHSPDQFEHSLREAGYQTEVVILADSETRKVK